MRRERYHMSAKTRGNYMSQTASNYILTNRLAIYKSVNMLAKMLLLPAKWKVLSFQLHQQWAKQKVEQLARQK